MKKLVILLLRLRLGLKIGERFYFSNQKNEKQVYFFTDSALMKIYTGKKGVEYIMHSGVSLNWLLSDKCQIRKAAANEKMHG